MKLALRLSLLSLATGLLVLTAILFRPYLAAYFVQPAAVVLWMLWQILLSVDQRVLWGILVFLSTSYAIYPVLRIRSSSVGQSLPAETGPTLDRTSYWRTSILYTTDAIEAPNVLKRDLAQLLVSMYSTRRPETPRLETYQALRQGRIPLPDPVHAFLFPAEPSTEKRSAAQLLQIIWQTPDRWARRWTGQEVAEYHRSIEEVLTLIEAALEIKHDDDQFDSPDH